MTVAGSLKIALNSVFILHADVDAVDDTTILGTVYM